MLAAEVPSNLHLLAGRHESRDPERERVTGSVEDVVHEVVVRVHETVNVPERSSIGIAEEDVAASLNGALVGSVAVIVEDRLPDIVLVVAVPVPIALAVRERDEKNAIVVVVVVHEFVGEVDVPLHDDRDMGTAERAILDRGRRALRLDPQIPVHEVDLVVPLF